MKRSEVDGIRAVGRVGDMRRVDRAGGIKVIK